MSQPRRRKLESTVAAIQRQYGPQALQRARDLPRPALPPHVPTGFAALDQATGCGGIPLGALTLLCGRSTSGKLTMAYKTLAHAQQTAAGVQHRPVAILDLSRHSDPDYLARCGVDLTQLLVARPPVGADAVDLLLDLLESGQASCVLLDSLDELAADGAALQRLRSVTGALLHHLRRTGTALLVIHEPDPPWLRWLPGQDRSRPLRRGAALQIEVRRERWLREAGELVGYRALATVRKSQWRRDMPRAPIEIHFNGTVQAGRTW